MACQKGQSNHLALLELPIEIRLKIYEFVFRGSRIYVQLVGEDVQTRHLRIHGEDVSVLLTCRQIYHEARSEWYISDLWTLGFPPVLGRFLRSTSSASLARVTFLTIQIHELPDLNTKLLPSLRMLVIDFTTDLPGSMSGKWSEYDENKIYWRFADEAVARVHSTFKILITELHEESRTFHLGLIASTCVGKGDGGEAQIWEIFVNLDTRLVVRRLLNVCRADEQDLDPEGKFTGVKEPRARRKPSTGETSGSEHYPEPDRRLLDLRRCKVPPGRKGRVDQEDKDDRGSIRESDQEDESDDESDEETAFWAESVHWEHVKRIIEHPSEDEQSLSEEESEKDDEEHVSDSPRLEAEVDSEKSHPILESGTANAELEPEQQLMSTAVSIEENTKSKVQVPAMLVAGDQHRRAEERVIFTTRWPEPSPSLNGAGTTSTCEPISAPEYRH